MEDVIDTFEQDLPEPVNLKRSARLFKISLGLFIFSMTTLFVIRPMLLQNYKQLDWLVGLFSGLPILAMFVSGPIGLFNSWKSYRKKEGVAKARLIYLIGNLFSCLPLVLFILLFIKNIVFP